MTFNLHLSFLFYSVIHILSFRLWRLKAFGQGAEKKNDLSDKEKIVEENSCELKNEYQLKSVKEKIVIVIVIDKLDSTHFFNFSDVLSTQVFLKNQAYRPV